MRFKGLIFVGVIFSILILPSIIAENSFSDEQIITLQHESGPYLSINSASGSKLTNGLNANRYTVGDRERFMLVVENGGDLFTEDIASFVSVETTNPVKQKKNFLGIKTKWIYADDADDYGEFKVRVYKSDGSFGKISCGDKVYFKKLGDNEYLDIDFGKKQNSSHLGGSAENFTIKYESGDCPTVVSPAAVPNQAFANEQTISIKHSSSKYLSINSIGDSMSNGLNANKDSVAANSEKFVLESTPGTTLKNGAEIALVSKGTENTLRHLRSGDQWINAKSESEGGGEELSVRVYKYDRSGGEILCGDQVYFETEDGKYIDIDEEKGHNPAGLSSGLNRFAILFGTGDCSAGGVASDPISIDTFDAEDIINLEQKYDGMKYLSINSDSPLDMGLNANRDFPRFNEEEFIIKDISGKLGVGDDMSFYSERWRLPLQYGGRLDWIHARDIRDTKLEVRIFKEDGSGGDILCGDAVYFKIGTDKYMDVDVGERTTYKPVGIGTTKNIFYISNKDGECSTPVLGDEICSSEITKCCKITSPGEYKVINDIVASGKDCIAIEGTPRVNISGANKPGGGNYKIIRGSYTGIGVERGIYAANILYPPSSSDGVQISHLDIEGFDIGILLGTVVEDRGSTPNVRSSWWYPRILNVKVKDNNVGVYLDKVNYAILENIIFDSNNNGLKVAGSYGLKISSSESCNSQENDFICSQDNYGNPSDMKHIYSNNGENLNKFCKVDSSRCYSNTGGTLAWPRIDIDYEACTGCGSSLSYCGDGVFDRPNDDGVREDCDTTDMDGFSIAMLQATLELDPGTCTSSACDEECMASYDCGGTCGNQDLEDGELCEKMTDGTSEVQPGLTCANFNNPGCTIPLDTCKDRYCTPDLLPCDACGTTPELDCGNGVLDSGEECDDNNNVAGDACSPTCKLEHTCPNNVIERPNDDLFMEECDTEKMDGFTCDNIKILLPECETCVDFTCTDQCTAILDSTEDKCGDGTLGNCELCDDTVSPEFHSGVLTCADFDHTGCTIQLDACTDHCTPDLSPCSECDPVCGNDMIDGTDVCDGDNLDDWTCVKGGFQPGILSCEADCTALDYSRCGDSPQDLAAFWVDSATGTTVLTELDLNSDVNAYMKVVGLGTYTGNVIFQIWEEDLVADGDIFNFVDDKIGGEVTVAVVGGEASTEVTITTELLNIISEGGDDDNMKLYFKASYSTSEELTSEILTLSGSLLNNCSDNDGDELACKACPANGPRARKSVSNQDLLNLPLFGTGDECGGINSAITDNPAEIFGECGDYIECTCIFNSPSSCEGDAQTIRKNCPVDPNSHDVTAGNCTISMSNTNGDCSTDNVVSYSWVGVWKWNDPDNKFTSGQLTTAEETGGNYKKFGEGTNAYWRYDPKMNNGLKTMSELCTAGGTNSIICPAKIKLPFFGGFSFIVSLMAFSLIYLAMNCKIKKRE